MDNIVISTKPLGFYWETKDPFLFCAHHKDAYPKGNEQMGPVGSLAGRNIGNDFIIRDGWRMYHGQEVPGFPVHPHRGFETITISLEGFIDHSDSLSAAGRYGNGDVQWMTAGKGMQHAEMFPLINTDKPNPLELFQVWINLPKSKKYVDPFYKMFWSETIPRIKHIDKNSKSTEVILIAGELAGKSSLAPSPDSWASDPTNNVVVARLKMESGATYIIPSVGKGISRMLYFYKGKSIKINQQQILDYHSVDLNPELEATIVNQADECELLILQGKPIGEPVVQYGPFVMNTDEEIQNAIKDYRTSEFGGWPWPEDENVHPREATRFAKYSDGSIEYPPTV